MGQTESRKLKRNKKSLVFPKTSPEFMETFPKNNSTGVNKGKDGGGVGKKNVQTRGVAMSFGFRKRPVTSSSSSVPPGKQPITHHIDFSSAKKQEEKLIVPKRTIINRESTVEKEELVPKQNEANRFGFRFKPSHDSTRTENAISSSSQPSRKLSEPRLFLNKPENVCNSEDYASQTNLRLQSGKYTLQTTELPQLEPVRVIESKIEKTLINTRRKTGSSRQQYDNDGFYSDSPTLTNCSVKNNNEVIHTKTASRSYLSYSKDESFNNNKKSEDVSNVCFTPSKWSNNYLETKPVSRQISWKRHDSTKECQERSRTSSGLDGLPEPDLQKTFFKLKLDEISNQGGQSDLWDNAGEAMALDITQLSHRSSRKYNGTSSNGPLLLQTSPPSSLTRVPSPFNVLPTLNSPDSNLVNEDLGFISVASAGATGMLLDDEILSPIESLSSSEAETNTKSSLSKDINEKSPDSTPPSPTNVSSMSLVEEKDFLIDDEIADQPGLTFKSTRDKDDAESVSVNEFRHEGSLRNRLFKAHHKIKGFESSPLSLKNRRLFSTGSLDSSSCESIASDDYIMDYDSSHTNDFQRSPRSKSSEKPSSTQDVNITGSPWLEREVECPSFTNTFSESRNVDSLNYNFNNGFTLNLSVKQSPTIQKDVKDIRRLLVKLKMLLNDSDVIINNDEYLSCQSDRINENVDNSKVVEKELADLRRQVLFLQVQLENKEETLTSLQKQIADLSTQNHNTTFMERDETEIGNRMHCNAATQTKRIVV